MLETEGNQLFVYLAGVGVLVAADEHFFLRITYLLQHPRCCVKIDDQDAIIRPHIRLGNNADAGVDTAEERP